MIIQRLALTHIINAHVSTLDVAKRDQWERSSAWDLDSMKSSTQYSFLYTADNTSSCLPRHYMPFTYLRFSLSARQEQLHALHNRERADHSI